MAELADRAFDELNAEPVDDAVADLVVAALIGDDELAGALGGAAVTRPTIAEHRSEPASAIDGVYLAEIEVTGVRGIGATARLGLLPRPGLTVVVGRNGSGKSTFAEATELALTGDSSRWSGRSAQWRDGWSNLHHDAARGVVLKLREAARHVDTTITRSWSVGGRLEDAHLSVQRSGDRKEDVGRTGLDHEWQSFRPFLSYNELGGLLQDGPAKAFDAITSVLGTDELDAATARVRAAAKDLAGRVKLSKEDAQRVAATLAAVDDERATIACRVLQAKKWDLDALEPIVSAAAPAADSLLGWLDAILRIEVPSTGAVEAAASEIEAAHEGLGAVAGSDAERARQLASLLASAIAFHDAHAGETDCPVCGTPGRIDEAWAHRARAAVDALRSESQDAAAAHARLAAAVGAGRALVRPAPVVLAARHDVVDTTALTVAFEAWSRSGQLEDPSQLIVSLRSAHAELVDALDAVQEIARSERDRRADAWAPHHAQLVAWYGRARQIEIEQARATALKAAGDWLEALSATVRNERFAPIRDQVREIWELLRRDSNVAIDDIALKGKSTSRKLELAVNVDGVPGAAVSVMSQGELHALALSLFLPRATLPTSPFRFVMIDDPVQAMDAARIDGLARVLEAVARSHQVVVFTHDERLPAACRHLGIAARVLEVTRGARGRTCASALAGRRRTTCSMTPRRSR